MDLYVKTPTILHTKFTDDNDSMLNYLQITNQSTRSILWLRIIPISMCNYFVLLIKQTVYT